MADRALRPVQIGAAATRFTAGLAPRRIGPQVLRNLFLAQVIGRGLEDPEVAALAGLRGHDQPSQMRAALASLRAQA